MEVIDDGGCGAVGGNGVVLVAAVVVVVLLLFLWLECSSTVSVHRGCVVQCSACFFCSPCRNWVEYNNLAGRRRAFVVPWNGNGARNVESRIAGF